MASCVSCGRETGGASFCPSCGANQSSSGHMATATATGGLDENIAGLLCYLFSWVSGLVFLLVDKRPFVRFHGAQSIALTVGVGVVMIALSILFFILTFITAMMGFPIGLFSAVLFPLAFLGSIGAFIFCMVKAYQHEKYKLPIIGDMVEKWVG
jgi:uncharacterized membrane protein